MVGDGKGIVESANDTTILPFGSVGNGKPPCFLLRKSPCLTIKEHETFPRILHCQRAEGKMTMLIFIFFRTILEHGF